MGGWLFIRSNMICYQVDQYMYTGGMGGLSLGSYGPNLKSRPEIFITYSYICEGKHGEGVGLLFK